MAVSLFDPLGVLMAASAINQFRVHRGYHYPRSTETVREILAARTDFLREFAPAIVRNTEHYYAIPSAGSLTSPPEFERFCASFDLPIEAARPPWMNFDFIDRCYKVAEEIYDPDRLREILRQRLAAQKIDFIKSRFDPKQEDAFDHVVYATYGASGSHRLLFDRIRIQVAEKVLIKLPGALQRKAPASKPVSDSGSFASVLRTRSMQPFGLPQIT